MYVNVYNYLYFSAVDGHQKLVLDSSLNLLLLQVNVTNMPSPWKPLDHSYNTSSPWRPLDHTHNGLSPWRPAEDAHNTALNISIPPSLIYSGVRTKVDQNDSRTKQEGSGLNQDYTTRQEKD